MEDEDWVFVRRFSEADMVEADACERTSSEPLKVVFKEPAKHWTDAIPIGNGRIGAMVWGGTASEVIQLNEDTLWSGGPSDYTNPAAPSVLSNVRNLVDSGRYADATAAATNLLANPPDVYQPLGYMKLEFDESHHSFSEETYYRELDLDTATCHVKYAVGEVEFSREHFASNPDQVIATKISGSKSGSLSLVITLGSELPHGLQVRGRNLIVMKGRCPTKRIPPRARASDNASGIQFSAVLHVQIGGDTGKILVVDQTSLKVHGSDWAILLLSASSSFEGPFTKPSDSKTDPTSDSLGQLMRLMNVPYPDLYARHLRDYQNLFHRVGLYLKDASANRFFEGQDFAIKNLVISAVDVDSEAKRRDDVVSTAERIKSFRLDEDPFMVELLFHFGRYLLISCSRPGTQVANLQGIWNKDLEPSWDCAPHLNINLQMNYWPSLPCNLGECQEPLFDFIKSLSINGSKTVQVNYETRGWAVHHVSDIWAKSSPDGGDPVWALWPMGGAWLCTHLWEHYCYSMDKEFLKEKAYPLLEGCATFLLDWLLEGREGYVETNPSTSPEHMFVAPDGKPASVSYSTTMDMAIIREVFSAFISATEVLRRPEDEALVRNVRAAQEKLCPARIAPDGSIMEWAQNFKDPDVHHRHLSHLFGLFPGHTITIEKDSALCKSAEISLYHRGEEGPGWSTAWKSALWARLRRSEQAYEMVKKLITLVDPEDEKAFGGGLYSNLFASHPPFQIDANFGLTASVAEMLVQSTLTDLHILPALPADKWPDGCARGFKARGGLTVNISWKAGDLHKLDFWSNKSSSSIQNLIYRATTSTLIVSPNTIYTYNSQLNCVKTTTATIKKTTIGKTTTHLCTAPPDS